MGDVMSLDQLDKVKADTREILDKLSAMRATPVSELPGKYTIVDLTGKTETEYTDLVNVTGSGLLRCALVFPRRTSGDTSSTANIQIIIDGTTFSLGGRAAQFGNGFSYECGFVKASDIVSRDESSNYNYWLLYDLTISLADEYSAPASKPATRNSGVMIGDTELSFKNQLIIKGRCSSGNSYDAFIIYSLDD